MPGAAQACQFPGPSRFHPVSPGFVVYCCCFVFVGFFVFCLFCFDLFIFWGGGDMATLSIDYNAIYFDRDIHIMGP